ncbi:MULTISPECIES: phage tail tip lysozyme [unclassified Lactococcus]|uniref:phage tail tip lysozyme n=1 Tax=unclassified Lactococcus TaxID=2643510 RepID=UPI0011C96060|nr:MULTISPECIES: phage tail tip lysozyme [unclassified Lactococcus]MQW23424.1 CHAP domain-containing protein [Lactococcus sp. dk101]TXK37064.1 CHAP domain-containing protein [Lactococcus sp. dk310]TXK37296.1 CHAP domain-containing protein [Lactococcus sp. dk310]TXK47708.1 CHAP domain-containing protein [Lactococcus sp. dk322]
MDIKKTSSKKEAKVHLSELEEKSGSKHGAKIASKAEYMEKKRDAYIHKTSLKKLKKEGGNVKVKDLSKARAKLKLSKKEAQQAKFTYKKAKKRDPKALKNKMKSGAKISAKKNLTQEAQKALAQDDVLSDGLEQYHKLQGARIKTKMTSDVVKASALASKNIVRHGYGLTNRSYNLIRKRGFVRTPEELTLKNQARQKARNFKNRLQAYKKRKDAEKGVEALKQVFTGKVKLTKAVAIVVSNPITWIVILISMILFIVMGALTASSSAPIKQDDFQLTKSWTYFTELDAQETNTTNSFYTSLDEVMFYMNHEFEDYDIDSIVPQGQSTSSLANQNFKQYATGLWTALNGSAPDYDLKTMEALETDSNSKYYIPTDNYEEMQELVSEIGYDSLDGKLEFPFATEVLTINRRFGYERNGEELKLHTSIETSVSQGQNITSPMEGKVSVGKDKLVITEKGDARLTVSGITTSRFKEGDNVKTNALLGTATGSTLSISYEKYNEDSRSWEFVNPGFYFPKVAYTQFTSIGLSNFNPDSDMAKNAQKIYDILTKLGYHREGISAILGNWEIESSINPKTAEGDYLNPPVGASGSSWDDDAWLNMGGQEIYNGKYPNILHRGLGLGQWTDTADGSRRQTALRDYAKAKNKKWYDLELQLDFILNGDSPGSRTIFKNTAGNIVGSSVPQLTEYFLNYWEGNPGNKLSARVQSAQNWYNYFTNNSQNMGSVTSQEVYNKYKDKIKPLPTLKEMGKGQGWAGNGYALGNCTWYVYNREAQLGHHIYAYMGNGGQWGTNYRMTPGATASSTPKVGDAVSFLPGVTVANNQYGHVAVVEFVNADGTFVVSEMNWKGLYSMNWRVVTPQAGMTFIHFN